MTERVSSPTQRNGIGETEEELPMGGKVMTLYEHLGELRDRVVRSFIAVVLFFFIAMGFSTEIIDFLKQPLIKALPEGIGALHFTGPLDVFLTSIKVSFLTSVVFACPFWLYQFWKFIEPALYKHERKYIFPFILASVSLFIAGISFCYFFILPIALEFLIGLGMEVGIPIITITDYTSMLILMIFGFGLVFETPLILVLLAILDLISAEGLRRYRRFVAVGIVILGALLTPPDPMSQIGMAIPLYLMYELSILIIGAIKKEEKP